MRRTASALFFGDMEPGRQSVRESSGLGGERSGAFWRGGRRRPVLVQEGYDALAVLERRRSVAYGRARGRL